MGRLTGKYQAAYTDEMDHPRFRNPSPDGGYDTDHLKRTVIKGAGRDGTKKVVERTPRSKHNWEHFNLDDDNHDSKERNESAYSFYDFDDEEVEQMEDDRIASISERSQAKERAKNFKGSIDGTEGSDFTYV